MTYNNLFSNYLNYDCSYCTVKRRGKTFPQCPQQNKFRDFSIKFHSHATWPTCWIFLNWISASRWWKPQELNAVFQYAMQCWLLIWQTLPIKFYLNVFPYIFTLKMVVQKYDIKEFLVHYDDDSRGIKLLVSINRPRVE